MRRILVTGAAGFIGSYLCEEFLGRGDQVTALDDLSAGSLDNLASVRGERRFEFVCGSVLDHRLVDRLVGACDSVVHMAAVVGVRQAVDRPLRVLHTIINGTDTVLAAAQRHGSQRVVIASSSEVYGKNPGLLHEEAETILGSTAIPRWSYGAAKAADEYLGLAYWREHGLPVVLPRLFNTVGPRQSPAYGMVLPRLVRQALRGEELTVYGDGGQSRCFCHVSDAVRAIVALHDHPDAVGRVFNVAAPESVTILDLAERVIRVTGSASRVRLVPYQEVYGERFEETRQRRPDITRINGLLGWWPRLSLDDTVVATVAAARAADGATGVPRAA